MSLRANTLYIYTSGYEDHHCFIRQIVPDSFNPGQSVMNISGRKRRDSIVKKISFMKSTTTKTLSREGIKDGRLIRYGDILGTWRELQEASSKGDKGD